VPSVRVKPRSSQGLDPKASIARVARRSSLPSLSQRRTLVASEPSSKPMLHVRLLVRVLAGMLNRLVDITAFRPHIGIACAYQCRQQVGKAICLHMPTARRHVGVCVSTLVCVCLRLPLYKISVSVCLKPISPLVMSDVCSQLPP
jgi:hypothetical protein